jgi:hypothetical protein
MSYSLWWRSPALPYAQKQSPINVPAGSVVSDAASIRFTGKGASNYGKIQQENQLRLLENFAGPTPPDYATVGQTWYNTTDDTLKVCVSTEPFGIVWKSLSGTQITDIGHPAPSPAQLGDAWFQRTGSGSGILYVYTGLGRFPFTSTQIGGWAQIWPEIDLSAGRNEYNYMLSLVQSLIGDETFGGAGSIGRSIMYLSPLTVLDASLQSAWTGLLPHDQNVLRDISKLNELVLEPNSQDWDYLLSAARYAVNRLDLPINYFNDLSQIPFVQDGRPAPAELYAFDSSDVRYTPQDRTTNVRYGSISLSRLYQQTVNVLLIAVTNRYNLKGMTGAGSANPDFAPTVTEHPQASYSAPASSMNVLKTFSLNYNFEKVGAANSTGNNDLRFFNAGQALQVQVSYSAAVSAADIDLKAVCDTYGVLRLTHDASYFFTQAKSLSALPGPGYSALNTTNSVLLGTFSSGSATISYRAALATSGDVTKVVVYVDLITSAGGTSNVNFDFSFIADDETYPNPAPTPVYPLPTGYSSDDLIAPGGIAPPPNTTGVNTPMITTPANNANGIGETPTLTGTAFSVFGGSDTHASSDWQIWTGPNGTGSLVYSSISDTVNKTSITVPRSFLIANSTYYPRVRYTGASFGKSSFSASVSFKTSGVGTPAITNPADGSLNVSDNPSLTSTNFSGFDSDNHSYSDWQIWTGPGGTGTLVFSSYTDTINKTSISVPRGSLQISTTYYPQVRHTGTSGITSAYSAVVSFMTASSFMPTVAGQPYAGGYYGGKVSMGNDSYAIVIAPKATGESSYPWLTNIFLDDTWYSTSDSTGNTNALSRKSSPLAAWARGLTINGFSDWQIPASNVLEVLYRNFKPSTTPNAIAVPHPLFSAYPYTGIATTTSTGNQPIDNGIDLLGKGGLVLIKNRYNSSLFLAVDTRLGGSTTQIINGEGPAYGTAADFVSLQFKANGFNIVNDGYHNPSFANFQDTQYTSLTFAKAPKFFDIITYTGTSGSGVNAQVVPHNLGIAPGIIIVKRYDDNGNWIVYHRGSSGNLYLNLESSAAGNLSDKFAAVTSSSIKLNSGGNTFEDLNISGASYIAYLFAHDASPDGAVQCGSYTGNGVTQNVNFGFKPSFLLVKNITTPSDWQIFDSSRGFTSSIEYILNVAERVAQTSERNYAGGIYQTQTGFFVDASKTPLNSTGQTYVYMVIRDSVSAPFTAPAPVFSTNTYAGNGSTQTINNGIDLAVQGGLVWIKSRSNASSNFLVDTTRPGNSSISTNLGTNGAFTNGAFTNFTSSGFNLLSGDPSSNGTNATYVSWTFRKAPKFFDIVTYTGDGIAGKTIPHKLGQVPGMIVVKSTSEPTSTGTNGFWHTYHRGVPTPESKSLYLNTAQPALTSSDWNNTQPTASNFSIAGPDVNRDGINYVVYLFAHDITGTSAVQCGSYLGNGSGLNINLGFPPAFVMIKNITSSTDWHIFDTARGFNSSPEGYLKANLADAESQISGGAYQQPNGFYVDATGGVENAAGDTYVYMAIRNVDSVPLTAREPVFAGQVYVGNADINNLINTGVDLTGAGGLVWIKQRTAQSGVLESHYLVDTARGGEFSLSSNTNAAQNVNLNTNNAPLSFTSTGFNLHSSGHATNSNLSTYMSWTFKRAPKFFDVVTYTGDGTTANVIPHNLGLTPGMIIIKNANSNSGTNWVVYHVASPNILNLNSAVLPNTGKQTLFSAVSSTSITITANGTGADNINISGNTYVAYIFAQNVSNNGTSSCGSYTGQNGVQTIDLGFEPEFLLVKNITSAGDWHIYDRGRGFVSSTDPLSPNDNSLESSTPGGVYNTKSGFVVDSAQSPDNIINNTYIYMAIRNPSGVSTSVGLSGSTTGYGANTDVSPSTTAYTASDPTKTSVVAYAGGSETFNTGNYWSSTGVPVYQTTDSNQVSTNHYDALSKSFTDGSETSVSRDSTILARAVRLVFSGTAAPAQYVDDVFSAYTYTGTSQPGNSSVYGLLNNGVDLTKGGLIWTKCRINPGSGSSGIIVDTARGVNGWPNINGSGSAGSPFILDTVVALDQVQGTDMIQSVTTNGYNIGSGNSGQYAINALNTDYVSWTFRKAPKFFDIVTYTGNSSGSVTSQQIFHNLGQAPGMMFIKSIDSSTAPNTGGVDGFWFVYHQSLGSPNNMVFLNSSNAAQSTSIFANNEAPSSTSFNVSANGYANILTRKYVAYLFAHDPSPTGLIQCGSFTTDSLGNIAPQTLGWEPQFIMIKRADGNGNWHTFDTARGWTINNTMADLGANTYDAEIANTNFMQPSPTGFRGGVLGASQTYIYMAIRRSNKPPVSGTQIYNGIARTGNSNTITELSGLGFTPDLMIHKLRLQSTQNTEHYDRLRGRDALLDSNSTKAGRELIVGNSNNYDYVQFKQDGIRVGAPNQTTINPAGAEEMYWLFKRAPGFFDIVSYVGTGANTGNSRLVPHNLKAVPELIMVKSRDLNSSGADTNWYVYSAAVGNSKYLRLNTTAPAAVDTHTNGTTLWNNTTPTNSSFTVGAYEGANLAGGEFIAYVFASLPGISKVFSYTGNGSSQTINCGFSGGARFILIKCTSTTGDWTIWDTTRGIFPGNEGGIKLSSNQTELANDSIDTDPSGFIVNQTTNQVNSVGETYIGLAIS